jgi:hypothetical protein
MQEGEANPVVATATLIASLGRRGDRLEELGWEYALGDRRLRRSATELPRKTIQGGAPEEEE